VLLLSMRVDTAAAVCAVVHLPVSCLVATTPCSQPGHAPCMPWALGQPAFAGATSVLDMHWVPEGMHPRQPACRVLTRCIAGMGACAACFALITHRDTTLECML
jgi:hypothetical protein